MTSSNKPKESFPGYFADAGKLGESAVSEIAKGLEAVVNGKLDAKGDARAASQKITTAGNQLLSDPKAAIGNILVPPSVLTKQ